MRGTQRKFLQGAVGAWLLGSVSWAIPPVVRADGPPASAPNRAAPAPGTWTIAVIGSSTDAPTKALLQSLRSSPWVVANADRVKLAEFNTDASGRAATSGSTSVLVYLQGPRGAEMVGGKSGFAGAEDVIQWVRGVVSSAAEATVRDPNLARANHFFDKGQPSASAQNEYYPTAPVSMPQAAPVSTPSYSQPLLPQPQTTTTFAVPMTASTANVVQAPTQHLVIQQQPTQVMFAPASAPNLFMAGAMSAPVAAPMMAMSAPVGMQMVSVAAPPAANVGASPAPMAVGPTVAGASLTTSSVSVPASSTTSRVRVRGPGPVASALSRFGERLTTLGRTRIETVQETRLDTQAAQNPPGQFMTLSSTSASPVMSQPQNLSVSAPAPQCLPPLPQGSAQQYPQASPQGGHSKWH